MEKPDPSGHIIKMILVTHIFPNEFNPNRMTKEEFQQYVTEVRRLGRLPKPIIVRGKKGGYEIVDGEHAWRAAKEVGLTEVACEVIVADDFEAMRQCEVRNRGGTADPVKRGQNYRAMMEMKKLSARTLAQKMDVSEATIRYYLDYEKAARLRGHRAGEDRASEIAQLSHDAVRTYCRLPEEIRDVWADAGAFLEDLVAFYEHDISEILAPITESGLAFLLEPKFLTFRRSLGYLLSLCDWRENHKLLKDLDAYVRPVAELRLPADVLDMLPCRPAGEKAKALISAQDWKELLQSAVERAASGAGIPALVQSGVRVALRQAGIDPQSVCDARTAERLQIVDGGPAFIKEASHLTLQEAAELVLIEVDDSEEAVLEARRVACDYLALCREKEIPDDSPAHEIGEVPGTSVEEVLRACLAHVHYQQQAAEEDELFADPEQLLKVVLEQLSETEAISAGQIDGRPASEVMAERLGETDWPELFALASFALGNEAEEATRRWLEALGGEVAD